MQNYALAKRKGYGYLEIRPTAQPIGGVGKKLWPVLPLGWQISDFALEQMATSLGKNKEIAKVGDICRAAEAVNKH
ncbi:hypothetical protein ACFQZI_13280 [Mucilaginibacter lutimaris]|uniref:Uncharacterized protein n=1 Tax=Mucilaginibacter lutimaris TaxID=931629 RepID=A0ABW2ZI10_9SPHI